MSQARADFGKRSAVARAWTSPARNRRECASASPQSSETDSRCALRTGIGGIEPDGIGERGDGFLELSLPLVDAAQRGPVQRHSPGAMRGSLFEFGDGGVELAGPRQFVRMTRVRHGLGRLGAGLRLGPNRRRPYHKESDFGRQSHQ